LEFKIKSEYKPTGDQPGAIDKLVNGIEENLKYQTLLGVTGSGKTYTVANVIERTQKPTLVIAHNKTLAAQLYNEFKEFFPDNAVEYFVSYYDYYQPEAYVAITDTYIEKDSSVNDEIDKLRHSATASLFERNDVIIVASVSCIYGLGDPVDYKNLVLSLRPEMEISREEIMEKLINIQYIRNDMSFERGTFRVRGDIIEIFPVASDEKAIRVELFGDEVERISEINALTGEILGVRNHIAIFPFSHYVTEKEKLEKAISKIEKEMEEQVKYFKEHDKLIEAQRIEQRTRYDIEMLREMGYCQGIENYSRIISDREPGSRPFTLIDYFPDDFLIVVDESHVTLPQIRGMFGGDRSRKMNLVDFGFRLPSALDNRPLNFEEFDSMIDKSIFVSATPGGYEIEHSHEIVEQIIRPTGLLDPVIEIRPVMGQVDDLYGEISRVVERKERVLITTLTKKMSEDLTDYYKDLDVKVKYLHSDIDTLERTEIIRDLRLGVFDVLVGINLLREGLDIPEVSLVAILDADKEGFLRSETALIQTIGRAARNVEGKVLMYADKVTPSMERAITETYRRREKQLEYNEENDIVPRTIVKAVAGAIEATKTVEEVMESPDDEYMKLEDKEQLIERLQEDMMKAAADLDFEKAAELRDKIAKLKKDK
jgi:excinuclease ABC subunit B